MLTMILGDAVKKLDYGRRCREAHRIEKERGGC
jgi:hypothetical protein